MILPMMANGSIIQGLNIHVFNTFSKKSSRIFLQRQQQFLSPFSQLLLTLVKLRLDLHFKDLAYRFKIPPTTSSTYFLNMIEILYGRFKSLIVWPDRSVFKKNIPSCFREAFQRENQRFIEKPEKHLTQQRCWSNYNHHHTINVTPQGTISYISKAYGGRTSDKKMVELSDFCTLIKPDDVVLAIEDFRENQLHPLEIEETRHIAHVRIHVERIIGGSIPISMLTTGNNEDTNILDKIVVAVH
ncbi:hypothetical protein NQ317_001916 [Molorchus minor]|uniref:DDE Tnp4 domain-containing protein n=1 Tax=Molorchus minor TaxID=1323400 RepID=A0ABQ9JF00_9CUCU|nr:hypothetical protein NQ317_001916 [Molorchus minor]